MIWIGFIWLRTGAATGCFVYGDENVDGTKNGELDCLNKYQLLKKADVFRFI
jgi:hypothetical protein